MARDNAARCRALSPLGNSWLVVAAAILLAARGKTKRTRLKRSLKAAPASWLRSERGAWQPCATARSPLSSSQRVLRPLVSRLLPSAEGNPPHPPHVVKVHGRRARSRMCAEFATAMTRARCGSFLPAALWCFCPNSGLRSDGR